MVKRLTKAQREEKQKAALRQRIADIAHGAGVEDIDKDDDYWTILPDTMCRLLVALDAVFGETGGIPAHNAMVAIWNLDEYESLSKTTDFLWRLGYRA